MKKLTRSIAMMLVLIMMFSLIACSAPAANDDPTDKPSATQATPTQGASDPPTDDGAYGPRPYDEAVTVRIPMYDRGVQGVDVIDNYWTDYITAGVKADYNMDVEYIVIPRVDSSAEVTRYAQLIAVDEAPDLIQNPELPYAMNYYTMGALQPIDDSMMEEYMPDWMELSNEANLSIGYIDGVRYFIAGAKASSYMMHVGGWVRQDWMDTVGISDLPTNVNELNELLVAFRNAELGGNHTVPYARKFPNQVNITNAGAVYWMGDYSDYEHAMYMDINVPPFTWGPARDWMRWFNYLYNEGLVSEELPLEKTVEIPTAYFVTGQAGLADSELIYPYGNNQNYATLIANCPEAEVMAFETGAFCPEGAVMHPYSAPDFGNINGINVHCERPESVMMYINWIAKNIIFLQYGEEGKQHLVVNGARVRNAQYDGDDKLINGNNTDVFGCAITGTIQTEEGAYLTMQNNLTDECKWMLDEFLWDTVLTRQQDDWTPYVWTTVLETPGQYSTILSDKYNELMTRVMTCTPEEFDAVYEEACQEYLEAGYAEVLAEKEEQFYLLHPDYDGETDIHDIIK